ncbi:MAG: NUDIX domain-containing protein [bacterium]|nr:NUDIX domain-containing protein [bacterium]
MNNHLYIVNVEAAIFKHDKWLMAKRSAMEEHAAGTLALVGGKVEGAEVMNQILEKTLKREIVEEVGISIHDDMQYVRSSAFVAEDGKSIIDIVFICRHKEGEPAALDPKELSAVEWLTFEEIEKHTNIQSWTKESLRIAEQMRLSRQDNVT